eukprot:CAMPEP_0182913302 /NCGR_PEP_ID=MMETSP0034_2-20130328/37968_1 /TAXON_ID=156128 /ORGANISM="Nephroselmis pyriformis, Strain CCMP717" /LENGTH=196 /DNA_ID=CAMNT_0025050017 /DNA_START=14 /DNA_END=604 /DNA_ORIENTATION=+
MTTVVAVAAHRPLALSRASAGACSSRRASVPARGVAGLPLGLAGSSFRGTFIGAVSASRPRASRQMVVRAEEKTPGVKYNTEFGYSRKDVILIGVGITAFGFGGYWALQEFFGLDYVQAGNVMQLTVFLGLCVGWVGSYLLRVKNKDMTYVKQLNDYEEAVMQKRIEEMPENELQKMMDEVEAEKAKGVTRTRNNE